MALTYIEELVSEYYKHIFDEEKNPKYQVSERVPYQYLEPDKKVSGWHDIDVLAVSESENKVLIIETKGSISGKVEEYVEDIRKGLVQAEKFVEGRYKGKRIEKIFIAEWPSKTIIQKLDSYGIKTLLLKEVFREYFKFLASKVARERYGKEENNVTRTLISLIDNFWQELKEAGLL